MVTELDGEIETDFGLGHFHFIEVVGDECTFFESGIIDVQLSRSPSFCIESVLMFLLIHDEGTVAGIADEFHGVGNDLLGFVHIPRLTGIAHVSHELPKATLGCVFYDLVQFGGGEAFL